MQITKSLLNKKIFSSILGRTSYIGFYTDLLFIVACSASSATIVLASGSIFVGIFYYINGIVKDMNARILALEKDPVTETSLTSAWSFYLQEINMHVEVIK